MKIPYTPVANIEIEEYSSSNVMDKDGYILSLLQEGPAEIMEWVTSLLMQLQQRDDPDLAGSVGQEQPKQQ